MLNHLAVICKYANNCWKISMESQWTKVEYERNWFYEEFR